MADIITYPENGITYDADDASGYLATRLSGVYSAEEDFAVTAQGGLSVQVSAGQAWVRPARFKGRSIIMEQPTTVVRVSYTHLRAHETPEHLGCRLLLEKKKVERKFRVLPSETLWKNFGIR